MTLHIDKKGAISDYGRRDIKTFLDTFLTVKQGSQLPIPRGQADTALLAGVQFTPERDGPR